MNRVKSEYEEFLQVAKIFIMFLFSQNFHDEKLSEIKLLIEKLLVHPPQFTWMVPISMPWFDRLYALASLSQYFDVEINFFKRHAFINDTNKPFQWTKRLYLFLLVQFVWATTMIAFPFNIIPFYIIEVSYKHLAAKKIFTMKMPSWTESNFEWKYKNDFFSLQLKHKVK